MLVTLRSMLVPCAVFYGYAKLLAISSGIGRDDTVMRAFGFMETEFTVNSHPYQKVFFSDFQFPCSNKIQHFKFQFNRLKTVDNNPPCQDAHAKIQSL